MEDFGRLIVARQNDGVALVLEIKNGVDVVGKCRPFERRDHVANAVIERRSTGGAEGGCHLILPTSISDILMLSIRPVKVGRAAISFLRQHARREPRGGNDKAWRDDRACRKPSLPCSRPALAARSAGENLACARAGRQALRPRVAI